jgi:NADH-quinone oxidoreductase subunit F
MDLKLSSAAPTDDERAAVAAVLGPAREERDPVGLHVRRGRGERHRLLDVLHAVNDRVGWISRGAINHIAERLDVAPADIYGVATFYAQFSTVERPPGQVYVCVDLACRAGGGPTEHDLPAGSVAAPCLGACERAPATTADADPPVVAAVPQVVAGDLSLQLLGRIGRADTLDAYRAVGGYQALRRAFAIGPAAVIGAVTDAGLVGRGGAAFPTGRKWDAVATQPVRPHHLVCNADESEPGTFKDRVLMEGDPFAVIESMTIAAFATGCDHGWLYIRGEYPRARHALHAAIGEARRRGFLGADVLGSGFAFDVTIVRGAGAYICGEETAIFNSIEGYRGEPRNKPPFPVEVGLFGKPTLVNNVETLVCVLPLLGGAGARRKLLCLSGAVARPGVYEVELGATLGEVIELAGGVRAGSQLRAVLLGGAAGTFVGPGDLDMPLTVDGTRARGATLGSGVVLVLDDAVDLVDQVRRIAAFFRDESCGQCVPCRVGTVRQEELTSRLASGKAGDDDLALLADVAQVMRDASICGLGQTAPNAIQSAIETFGVFR